MDASSATETNSVRASACMSGRTLPGYHQCWPDLIKLNVIKFPLALINVLAVTYLGETLGGVHGHAVGSPEQFLWL